jgi:hypothetical protein
LIGLFLFSINILVPLGKPNYNLSFKELKRNIEIKKQEFLSKYPLLKDKIKVKKELVLSQKLLVEIPDSLLSYFEILGIPHNPDYFIPVPKLLFSYNDMGFWHKKFVEVDSVYKLGKKGKGIVIAVLDTGIDTSHPGLKGKVLLFKDFAEYGTISDPVGHGTYVSSLIVGDSAGIAPMSKIVVLKIFSKQGGYLSDIHEAFDYIAELLEQGLNIKIINGSFGTYPDVDEFFEELYYFKQKGIFLCFSAGNEGPSPGTVSAPANYPFVFSVGACDRYTEVVNFSSRGPSLFKYPWNDKNLWFFPDWNFTSPFLIAPGKDIKGAFLNKEYIVAKGTSASSPIFAGVCALLLSLDPELNPDTFAKILKLSLFKKHGNYPNYEEGFGYLKLKNILKYIKYKDTFFINVSKIRINSNSSYIFEGDSFYIEMEVVFSRYVNESCTLKVKAPENVRLMDTLFYFENTDAITVNLKAVHEFYIRDTIVFDIEFIKRDYKKNFKIFIPVHTDTLLTIRNRLYTFSISSTGSIGFLNSERKRGEGFLYRNFGNLLYLGTIAFGNSMYYVVDRFYEYIGIDDRDTEPLEFYDNRYFKKDREFYIFRFNDKYAPLSKGNEIGVKIKDIKQGFVFILKPYNFLKEEVYLASFFDFDIGDALLNYSFFDEFSGILGISKEGGPFCGIVSFNRDVIIGSIDNTLYSYPYQGLRDSVQYMFMSGKEKTYFRRFPSDYTLFISKKVLPPDSLIFVIFAGENYDTLFKRYERIKEILNQRYYTDLEGISRIWPNPFIYPFNKVLKIEVKGRGNINFFDLSGRKIKTIPVKKQGVHILNIDNPMRSGVYFLGINNNFKKLVYINLEE